MVHLINKTQNILAIRIADAMHFLFIIMHWFALQLKEKRLWKYF